jgi:hypothetical protein
MNSFEARQMSHEFSSVVSKFLLKEILLNQIEINLMYIGVVLRIIMWSGHSLSKNSLFLSTLELKPV